MTSWNMPPGCSVTDIPGWYDPPLWPTIRCDVCGCWIGYEHTAEIVRQEEHIRTYECKGGKKATCEDWFDAFYSSVSEAEALEKHPAHSWFDYDGMTTWYKCKHCGTEIPVNEF